MTDKLYKEFLLSSPVGFFHADLITDESGITDFVVLSHNNAFPELLNKEGHSLVGVRFSELFPINNLQRKYSKQ